MSDEILWFHLIDAIFKWTVVFLIELIFKRIDLFDFLLGSRLDLKSSWTYVYLNQVFSKYIFKLRVGITSRLWHGFYRDQTVY